MGTVQGSKRVIKINSYCTGRSDIAPPFTGFGLPRQAVWPVARNGRKKSVPCLQLARVWSMLGLLSVLLGHWAISQHSIQRYKLQNDSLSAQWDISSFKNVVCSNTHITNELFPTCPQKFLFMFISTLFVSVLDYTFQITDKIIQYTITILIFIK